MRRFRVVVNGLVYEVAVEELHDEGTPQEPSQVAPAPQPARQHRTERAPETSDPRPAPPSQEPPKAPPSGDAGEIISAPLPGTVLDVKVAPGEKVRAGQVLLILEAMKMENEIVAPRDGTVRDILVKKGQAVTTGDGMVRID